jgi:hypothetical protein
MLFRSRATAALVLTAALLAGVLALADGPAGAAGTAWAAPATTPADTASPTPTPTPSPSSSPLAAITIAPSPGNYVLSAANPAPVISGTITELAPGATAAPYADQAIVIDDSVAGDSSLLTSSTGGYSYQPSDPVPGETITVEVPATATNSAAAAPPVRLSAQLLLTAKLSASEVRYGTTVTVSGTVTGYASGGDAPLSGQAVQVYATGGLLAATTQTSAKGTFAAVLPREASSLSWTVQTGGGPYTTATDTLPMTVDLPTVITGFKATLNPFWQVSYQGCLGLAPGTPGYVPSLSGLTIQYAASTRGPWHTLGKVPTGQRSYVCGDDGRTFTGVLPALLASAYYRAVYAGSAHGSGAQSAGYLSSASGTVRSWRYTDRITDFKVTPHTVRQGGKLTISGKLQYHPVRTWLNLTRRTVLIILRPAGSKTWYWILQATTNSKGDFTVTFADPLSATWAAEYLGGKNLLAAMSPTVSVPVKR